MRCDALYVVVYCAIFFVKQKTAYEMRISDWSSDVCSSDLQKTKPTQHSVRDLRSNGLGPRYVLRFQFAFRLTSVALSAAVPPILSRLPLEKSSRSRSAERRVGKECVSTCRYWWSPSD